MTNHSQQKLMEDKMEEPNKPQQGVWESISTEEQEKKPQVKWEKIGDKHDVVFLCDHPKEYLSKDGDGVFLVFDVEEENEERVILTSAWSLIKGIKKHVPLKGKRLVITKEMVKGKQMFTVVNPDEPEEVN